jgi:hypothetical protein
MKRCNPTHQVNVCPQVVVGSTSVVVQAQVCAAAIAEHVVAGVASNQQVVVVRPACKKRHEIAPLQKHNLLLLLVWYQNVHTTDGTAQYHQAEVLTL